MYKNELVRIELIEYREVIERGLGIIKNECEDGVRDMCVVG